MQLSTLTSITGLLVLGYILELLRRQQLREKYAAIWLAIGIVVAPLGFIPDLLDSTAKRLGVQSGASLVLFAGFVLILLVSLHLSWEASRLEAETRTLAEDVALIRAHLVQQGGYPIPLSRPADDAAAAEPEVLS
ncbi:hypothetical protein P3T36_005916 [Kitasatospora sp. MAP12-15]|uniref:DUF2304 domain-containing protein n=1 Tax=unclassified Kitasatospora TaxID=2633591 RepID=UPI0024755FDB|nr:DUF2304 domain-containing protein [Kitasatospora sp. MAP12-44]MDH6111012.1 hypothetical protein [Kitasatospora sp. MAP12-44]